MIMLICCLSLQQCWCGMSLILVVQPAAPEVANQVSTSMTCGAVGPHMTLGRRLAVCSQWRLTSDRQHATMSIAQGDPKTCW